MRASRRELGLVCVCVCVWGHVEKRNMFRFWKWYFISKNINKTHSQIWQNRIWLGYIFLEPSSSSLNYNGSFAIQVIHSFGNCSQMTTPNIIKNEVWCFKFLWVHYTSWPMTLNLKRLTSLENLELLAKGRKRLGLFVKTWMYGIAVSLTTWILQQLNGFKEGYRQTRREKNGTLSWKHGSCIDQALEKSFLKGRQNCPQSQLFLTPSLGRGWKNNVPRRESYQIIMKRDYEAPKAMYYQMCALRNIHSVTFWLWVMDQVVS